MISETNPYLWASAAALFAGLAAGQALRAFVPIREGRMKAGRRRPRRTARAIALLSLGILCVAGLLVFAARGGPVWGIGEAGLAALSLWSALIFLAAFFAGFRPLAAGLPLVAVSIACFLVLKLALEGWLPLAAARAGGTGSAAAGPADPGPAVKIASFLPYEVGPSSFRGHLELLERDSVSVAQDLSLGSSAIALTIESLRLAGPLGFLAELAAPSARRPAAGGSAAAEPTAAGPIAAGPIAASAAAASRLYYRVAGVAAPGGLAQAFAAPVHVRLLDFALPLPAGAGLEPGGPPASREGLLGLGQRTRATGEAAPLSALEPLSFSLSEEGILSSSRD